MPPLVDDHSEDRSEPSFLDARPRSISHRWLPDTLGAGAVVIGAVLYLLPALWKGTAFGPYDLGTAVSALGHGLFPHVHNGLNGDQITELVPWNTLDWRLVHQSQLPLWNSYSGMGLPQLFNFQSSVFSLPDLISYLVPLKQAFLTAVGVKLVVAGTGAYALARSIGTGPLGAAFAGLTFELSGAFSAELGWPLSDTIAWLGWILAFCWLLYRRAGGRWPALGLSVSVAFALYAGFPEADVLIALTVVAFLATVVVSDLIRRHPVRLHSIVLMIAGSALGVALATPLLLPGAQLASISARSHLGSQPSLSVSTLAGTVFPGYFGYPLSGSTWFGPATTNFYESAAYVGVLTIVLAAVALTVVRRRVAVLGLIVASLVLAGVTWNFGPFQAVLDVAPRLGTVVFTRARVPLALTLAVLGGTGLDILAKRIGRHRVTAYWTATCVACVAVGAVSLRFLLAPGALTPLERSIRDRSVIWAVGFVAVAVVIGLVAARRQRTRITPYAGLALVVLVAVQLAGLIAVGGKLQSYSHRLFPANAAVARLKTLVGDHRIGLWTDQAVTQVPNVGLIPEMNVGYRVSELAAYDPMIPKTSLVAWSRDAHLPQETSSWFVPSISTARMARMYGTSYVLAPPAPASTPPPAGMRLVATVAGERLFRVDGASLATVSVPRGSASEMHPNNYTYRFVTQTSAPAQVRVRLTNVPGWQATIDGRPAAVHRWHGSMLQVHVASGRHTVVLRYWPSAFTTGLWLAGVALLVMLALAIAPPLARRIKPFSQRWSRTPDDS